MPAPLSTNSRYVDPSGFLACIDCNFPDNEEILLSPHSLFVVLFPLVSFLVCLNSLQLFRILGLFVFRRVTSGSCRSENFVYW